MAIFLHECWLRPDSNRILQHHAESYGAGRAGGKTRPAKKRLDRYMARLAGERCNRIKSGREVDAHLEVGRASRVDFDGNGRFGVVSNGQRLTAGSRQHPNVVCRQDGSRFGVQLQRARSVTERHQANAKELTQHTGAVVLSAEEHRKGGVHVDVGGAGSLRRQNLAQSDRRTGSDDGAQTDVVDGRQLVRQRNPVLVGERLVQVRRY